VIGLQLKPGENWTFRVEGLNEAALSLLAEAQKPPQDLQKIFAVYVASADPEAPPLFGEYRLQDGLLLFEPRFPLTPGMSYRAVYSGMEKVFSIPAPSSSPPAVVRHVFPSGDTLPENLLKLYLHFSAPMSRGEVYQRVRLLRSSGEEIEQPFLELHEELWDRNGTRLTVFFDPGRIKRGLKPREDLGPVLEEGQSYTLVIDAQWPDATGQPLKAEYRKQFRAAAPDDRQPDPKRWQIRPPEAESMQPLTILFDEPLDEAMLNRALAVVQDADTPVAGRVEIDQQEMRWRLHPESPWRSGAYSLIVLTALEDLAGNSIGRPFEVDVFRPVESKAVEQTIRLPFAISRAAKSDTVVP
jgi:uncharacterized membrane protein